MQNFTIFIVTVFCFVLSFRLFRRAAGTMSLLRLNTVSYVFYFQIFTSAVVGSMLLAMGKLNYHPYSRPISDSIKIEAWGWVMYSLITIPLGMLILNSIFKIKPLISFKNYLKRPVTLPSPGNFLKLATVVIILFSISSLYYLITNSVAIPLFTLLEGNQHLAAIQRVEVRHAFNGIEYIRSFAVYMLIPVFSYFLYIVAYFKKHLFFYIAYSIQLGLTFFVFLYDLQKSPIAFYLLGYLIIYTLIKGGISIKQFVFLFILPISLILFGYQLTTGQSALRLLYEWDSAFYGRIFLTSYFAFPLSLELFPDVITEPTYYSGIPTAILNYLGIENIESARRLMMYMNPKGVNSGTANLFSGYFLAEAWANYKYVGLILSPFWVGAIIQAVHIYLLKHKKEALLIAFYAFVTVKWLLSAGVVSFIYLKIILYPFIIYLIVKTSFNILRNIFLKFINQPLT